MNNRLLLISAALSTLVLSIPKTGHSAPASAKADQEKCFGICKAGENDCATASGSHSCANLAKTDKNPSEWKWVAKGTCVKAGGKVGPAK